MSTLIIKAPPQAELVEAYARADLSWKLALGEWIDNAFDAEATTVRIELGSCKDGRPEWISVRDDGKGTSDLEAFFALGRHVKGRIPSVGRYGVGAKESALWLGGTTSTFRVSSVKNGRLRTASAQWQKFARNNWELEGSEPEPAEAGEEGTKLTVAPVIRKVPQGSDWTRLLSDLGYLYSAALKRGCRILVVSKSSKTRDVVELKPYKFPEFEKGPIDTLITVGGKKARVYVGLVKSGAANDKPGISYIHKFRVIQTNCGHGCGEVSPARIAGFVEMIDEPGQPRWDLTKNKNGISEDTSALYEAVQEACQPILAMAAQAKHSVDMQELDGTVETMANAMLGLGDPNAKAVRGKGDTHGAVEPKKTGRKHRNAKRKQGGETFHDADEEVRQKSGRIQVDYAPLGEGTGLGQFSGNTVMLNTSHPWVVNLRATKNTEAIVSLVITIYVYTLVHERPGAQLPIKGFAAGDPEAFKQAIASRLVPTTKFDGKPLTAAAAE